MMLRLSDDAVEALRDVGPIRITAEVEGDEVELEIEPAEGEVEGDEVVEQGDARVYLDPTAAETLDDQIMHVEAHGDHFHFAFEPQET